uniref:Rpn family recombination-promoting nuclease/putative transposase n=1 Tax=Prevotella sp. TaxID=59823 RepID=UPI0040294570
MTNLISFDWAMKRVLRDKANHAVLEGLMTSLLNEKFTIVRFLESESNQEDENDKFNRVDILAESEKGELTIFEIQNNRELAYFHRILYGVSKAITDYINLGEDYEKVRKVYSINIVYFTLGQAKDYVYHGKTVFQGLHDPHDILKLSNRQSEVFFGDTFEKDEKSQREAGDIFPEYYLLCVNNFDKVAKTHLDEWIRFLKTGEIEASDTAPGLADAKECLDVRKLSREELLVYQRHKMNEAYQRSVISTGYDDGMQDGIKKGRAEGRAEGMLEVAKNLLSMHLPIIQIMQATGLTQEQIKRLKN